MQEPTFQNQKGSGHPILDPSVIQIITQQVIDSLKSAYTVVPNVPENSQLGEGLNTINSDLLNPLPIEIDPKTDPLPFVPIIIHKSKEHDQFDHTALIAKLPKLYQERATKLLEVFDNHADQITFNETGTIFLNGTAVVNSNFFQILPYLFSTKPKRPLPGFNELVTQICSMGYGKLINNSLCRGLHRSKPIPNSSQLIKDIHSNSKIKWYYLGN